MSLLKKKKKNLVFGYGNRNRGSRMEEVIASHNKTVPGVLFLAVSSDHKLECVQKREKVDRACNMYAGKD